MGDQLEPMYNRSVLIQDVAWKIFRERWTIETNGVCVCVCVRERQREREREREREIEIERDSEKSVLAPRHDDEEIETI